MDLITTSTIKQKAIGFIRGRLMAFTISISRHKQIIIVSMFYNLLSKAIVLLINLLAFSF